MTERTLTDEQRMMPIGECNLVGKVIGKYVEY